MQRALFTALDKWVTAGTPPPPSQVPRLSDGTLVEASQASTGFPRIPGVNYIGLKTTRYLLNYGPDFYKTGIPTIDPPVFAPPYRTTRPTARFIRASCRRPMPMATTSQGFAFPRSRCRSRPTRVGRSAPERRTTTDAKRRASTAFPFPKTKADRLASNNPRASIEERYGNLETYSTLLQKAIGDLSRQGFLLPFDAELALTKNLNNVQNNNLLPKTAPGSSASNLVVGGLVW